MAGETLTDPADLVREPLAAWDVRTSEWWEHSRQEKEDWLKAQGLTGNRMYRIEFFLADMPCARIFCYHLNEYGQRHWTQEHIPGPHDHSNCGPAKEPPRMVPLASLPPRELLGAPA